MTDVRLKDLRRIDPPVTKGDSLILAHFTVEIGGTVFPRCALVETFRLGPRP